MPLTPQEKAEMNGKGFAPKPKAEQGGSGHVFNEGAGGSADPVAQQQQAEQFNPLALAQFAGAAEITALDEARVQGGIEVKQAAIAFLSAGGTLEIAAGLLNAINTERRTPQTDLPLPADPALAMLALRSAIATLRQRALATPGFFAIEADGTFSLPRSTGPTPYSDALNIARTSAPALRPAFPSTQRQLGGSQ